LGRGQEAKTKESRTILRHLTVTNDGGIKLRGINRKKSILDGREVKIARVQTYSGGDLYVSIKDGIMRAFYGGLNVLCLLGMV
jgi:hypothetical protein